MFLISVQRLFRCRALALLPPSGCRDVALSVLLARRMQCHLGHHNQKPLSTTAIVPFTGDRSKHDDNRMTGANGSPRSSVVVFWDWENCPIPEPKYSMARLSALRQLAHTFGRNVTFRVYMDRAQLTAPRATAMRSRLYSAGIELVDCPHDGLKEVVDKAITVDMFEYALDNPAPSTLMLISGDRGYAPMLSRLSLRGYTVVIITPVTAQAGLRLAQCHAVYEWSDQLTLLESQDYANPTQPSGTMAAQSPPTISVSGSKSLPTSRTLPEENSFFSAAAKPVSDAQSAQKSTQSSKSDTAILKSPKKGEHPREPIAVESQFQTLVDILRTKRKEGVLYISYSELGQMLLKQQPDVYKEAGVSGMKKYTTLAQDDKIIVFKSDKSGPVEIGSNRFVGLHSRLL